MIKAVIVQSSHANGIPGENIFSGLPQFQLLGKAFSVQDGIQMIKTHQPNLVMLDMEMPDGESWQVFEATKGLNYEKIVFSNDVLSSFRVIRFEIGTQLKKPLRPEALKESVAKLLFSQGEYGIQKLYNRTFRRQLSLEQIFLPGTNGVKIVTVLDISRIEGTEDGCLIVFRNGNFMICTYPIDKVAKLLAYSPFFRINHQCLVQIHSKISLVQKEDDLFVCTDLGFRTKLPMQRVNSFKKKVSRMQG